MTKHWGLGPRCRGLSARRRQFARLTVPLAAIAVTAVLAACSSSGSTASTTSGGSSAGGSTALINVKLATLDNEAENAPVWYAQDAGIFKEYGLNVSVPALGGASIVDAALASGSVDVAMTVGTYLIPAVAQGMGIESVAVYSEKTGTELIANKKWAAAHNLTSSSTPRQIAAALVGAQVGAQSSGVEGHVNVLLKSLGVDPSKVDEVLVSAQTSEQSLLEAGKIDAFAAGAPLPNEMAADGQGTLLIGPNSQTVWSTPVVNVAIAANDNWAKSNSQTLTKLVSAIHEAEADLLQNPSATYASVVKNLPGTSTSSLAEVYDLIGFASCPKQTDALWNEDVKQGVLGGQFTSGTAKEGEVWTNQYVQANC